MADGNTRISGTLKYTANTYKLERIKWLFFLFLSYETLYLGNFSHCQGTCMYFSRLHEKLFKKPFVNSKVSFNLFKKMFHAESIFCQCRNLAVRNKKNHLCKFTSMLLNNSEIKEEMMIQLIKYKLNGNNHYESVHVQQMPKYYIRKKNV